MQNTKETQLKTPEYKYDKFTNNYKNLNCIKVTNSKIQNTKATIYKMENSKRKKIEYKHKKETTKHKDEVKSEYT